MACGVPVAAGKKPAISLVAAKQSADAHLVVGDYEEVAGRFTLDTGPETLENLQAFPLVSGANANEDYAQRGAALTVDELTPIFRQEPRRIKM